MKRKLVILSDMHGVENSDWLNAYIEALEKSFVIKVYDSRELGNVSTSTRDEKAIHSQFVSFGIECACKKLLETENKECVVLGFSVGGTIGWKFARVNKKVKHLLAVSSTRVRVESEKPLCDIDLFFGAMDEFTPSRDWFQLLELKMNILPNHNHEMYKNLEFVKHLCDFMIRK